MRLISFGSVCLVASCPQLLLLLVLFVLSSSASHQESKVYYAKYGVLPASKQMKLIQRSTNCGKDVVAKPGWPIASEEYLISFAQPRSDSSSSRRSSRSWVSSVSLHTKKLSYLIFMATQMRKLCPTALSNTAHSSTPHPPLHPATPLPHSGH